MDTDSTRLEDLMDELVTAADLDPLAIGWDVRMRRIRGIGARIFNLGRSVGYEERMEEENEER